MRPISYEILCTLVFVVSISYFDPKNWTHGRSYTFTLLKGPKDTSVGKLPQIFIGTSKLGLPVTLKRRHIKILLKKFQT